MSEQETTDARGQRKTRVGIVVSDAMDKTIVVSIVRRYMHPKYKKYIKERKRYKVHDEANECRNGDKVLIEECRPLSKQKRWKVKRILEKAPIV
jgi:small subunit ribosomal protein S17